MTGADDLIRRLLALPAAVQGQIKEELEITANDILTDAYRAADESISRKILLRPSDGGLTQNIIVDAGNMGAYLEFGTGPSAAALVPTLPQEWQDKAREFYINGRGRIVAKPYLYPAYLRHTTGLPDRIKVILDNAQL